jgi:hypothetical protein
MRLAVSTPFGLVHPCIVSLSPTIIYGLLTFNLPTDQQVIQSPRYEDFNIEYNDKNMWACLGIGYTLENRAGPGDADCSPYLNINNIDPKWLAATGGDQKVLAEQVDEANSATKKV